MPPRNYGADVLRILLCLVVVAFHYDEYQSCGSVAVDGFFILSGFLTVYASDGVSRIDGMEYYRKKAWRLLPTLVAAWLFGNVLFFIGRHELPEYPTLEQFYDAPAESFMRVMGSNGAAWFMICLLVFVAVWPLLRRYWDKPVFPWLLGVCFLFALIRSFLYPFAEQNAGGLYFQWTFRLWQFLLGMWCVSWHAERWPRFWTGLWIGTGVFLLLASALIGTASIGYLNYSFPGCLMSSIVMALCIASLFSRPLPTLSGPVLKWLGIGSGMTYALFLFHIPVKKAVVRAYGIFQENAGPSMNVAIPSALLKWAALAIAVAISYAVYQYVEVRWVGRMLKRRRAQKSHPPDGEKR